MRLSSRQVIKLPLSEVHLDILLASDLRHLNWCNLFLFDGLSDLTHINLIVVNNLFHSAALANSVVGQLLGGSLLHVCFSEDVVVPDARLLLLQVLQHFVDISGFHIGLGLADLAQLLILLLDAVNVLEDLILGVLQLLILGILDVLPLVSLHSHLLVDDLLLDEDFSLVGRLISLGLFLVEPGDGGLSSLEELLPVHASWLKLLPLKSLLLLHEVQLESAVQKLGSVFSVAVFDFVHQVKGQEELDLLGTDFDEQVGVEDVDVLHQHVPQGHLNRDGLFALGPSIFGASLLYFDG